MEESMNKMSQASGPCPGEREWERRVLFGALRGHCGSSSSKTLISLMVLKETPDGLA